MKHKFELGLTLRDKITGVQGIATSRHDYLTGCAQYALQQPLDKDGKVPELLVFDETRLEIVTTVAKIDLEEPTPAKKGGPAIRPKDTHVKPNR